MTIVAPFATRVGVFVDIPYLSTSGGKGLRFDALRRYAGRDGAHLVHLGAYASFDPDRAAEDERYRDGTQDFFRIVRDFGYRLSVRDVRWVADEEGEEHPKAGVEALLAVDAMARIDRLDRVLLVSGDADHRPLIHALQARGVRVEVIGFKNVSERVRQEADSFLPGYLLPGLLPINQIGGSTAGWGELDSRVRGICYDYRADRGFGFLRFHKNLEGATWITDTRHPGSAFNTAFVHATELERARIEVDQLPTRDVLFEFDLAAGKDKGFEARNVSVVQRYSAYKG